MAADIKVLCIDDEQGSLAVLCATCEMSGFEVMSTHDPGELLELAVEFDPDVILMDVMMPNVDGFTLCKRVKDNPDTALLPVVLITALTSLRDQIRGIEAGCDDFISKPFDRLQLTARVRSLARVKRLTQHLDSAQMVLESLARSVEAKDPTTGDHCNRLIAEGRAFGSYLGLSGPDVYALERAGVLHDVGKIGIPDAILLKPGKLDAAEWEVMKTHTVIGADLLSPLRTQRRVVPIVRSHHEKWNGSGYPDGLAGEEIPYLARVFAILDIYDALTSERPYKRAFTVDEALSILREECDQGKLDPQLVHTFIEYKLGAMQAAG